MLKYREKNTKRRRPRMGEEEGFLTEGEFKKIIAEKDNKVKDLEKQIDVLLKERKTVIHDYPMNHAKFGLIGDNHMCSIWEHTDFLHYLYKQFKQEGIETVYNCGDLVDGEGIWRGQQYEVHKHGVDQQAEYCIKNYPDILKTFFITGNHDLSFYKTAGVDVGKVISNARKDMEYLGQEEANIKLGGENKVMMTLFHPGGGTAYALSYHPQKFVESLSGGKKPHILCIGHYHKAEFIPELRNVAVIQAGTTCGQTSFMKRKKIAAHIGGWIIDVYTDKTGLKKIRCEFIPYYEK